MKTFAIVSALASVALAQSSTASASALIPTGISSGCSSFLTAFNSNSALSACTSPLISATSSYGPGGNASATSAGVSSALSAACSATTCSETTVRDQLTQFYAACTAELTSSPNDAVVRAYDVLYALTPLKKALCAKDDSGKYCAAQLSSIVSSASASASAASASASAAAGSLSNGLSLASVQKYLWASTSGSLARRASSSEAALIPNTTTYAASNLVFLFLQPALESAALCTSCTRAVLTSYIDWESDVPYAPGLANSPTMAGQAAIYNAVQSTCGSSFLSGAVQAAGSLSNGLGQSSGAAPAVALAGRAGTVVAAIGAVVLGAVAVL
ncbi:hypothetical protein PUNSTDRAFT_55156 [Punctularia strigosozonata HHB-11173 SS5]|uniref:DUF7729 domain-containing protein n=1 Tax=Punctularia strigosozonata (strain HHB-11173) TaxID=741275 RepID=R7S5L6_PUNST|nr:uncharacterized protein PUNSTDRAFT_55156 [Punctularia strigosozonata HHB-11173 SS5]EIN05282.1 hypothetical protein PUNSTDRAFT_55156 [Punctularia strigosozonata HHB-11173 SS5]